MTMLEFEETNAPMKAEVTAPTGFVVIPVEQYNDLLMRANRAPIVKVEDEKYATYPRIEASVDRDWLYAEAIKALHEKYSEEELAKYDIKDVDDLYVGSTTVATATAEVKAAIDAAKVAKDAELAPGAETL